MHLSMLTFSLMPGPEDFWYRNIDKLLCCQCLLPGKDCMLCSTWSWCPWCSQSLLVNDCNRSPGRNLQCLVEVTLLKSTGLVTMTRTVLVLGSEWVQGTWISEVAACVVKWLIPLFVSCSSLRETSLFCCLCFLVMAVGGDLGTCSV